MGDGMGASVCSRQVTPRSLPLMPLSHAADAAAAAACMYSDLLATLASLQAKGHFLFSFIHLIGKFNFFSSSPYSAIIG